MLKEFFNGILSGLMIAIGGSVFLAVGGYVGAIMFSVALYTICIMGFSLFTGKVGFIAIDHSKDNILKTLMSLLANFVGCVIFGLMLRFALTTLADNAEIICQAKLGQSIYSALIRAIFCGILMFIAVWVYRKKNSIVGIFICIPVFILSGFEHSIADMFYFAIAGSFNLQTLGYLAIIVIGNAIGGMMIPLLQKLANLSGKKQIIEVVTDEKN